MKKRYLLPNLKLIIILYVIFNFSSFAQSNQISGRFLSWPPPSNIIASNIGVDNAVLSWITGGSSIWNVEIGIQGFVQGTGTLINNVSSNPYTLSGLSSMTPYDVYIQDSCGIGDESSWIGPLSFVTQFGCPGSTVYSAFSENWSNGQSNWTGDFGTGYGEWQFASNGTTTGGTGPNMPHSGSQFLYFESSFSGGSAPQTAAIYSPLIDLSLGSGNASLSFFLHGYGTHIPGSDFKVGISNTLTGPFTYLMDTTFATQLNTSEYSPYNNVSIDISAYLGQSVYLAFEFTKYTGYEADLAIDQIEVKTCVNCLPPSNITISNTANSTAVIDWISGGANNWNLQYGYAGFTLGNGTVHNNITSKPYTLQNLTPGSFYQIYVQDICSPTNVSTWIGPVTFYTTGQVLNGAYTIGHGSAYDFQSFTAAASALTIGGISGPVTFSVATDTYNEQVYFDSIPGASSTNTITFTSASNDSSLVILQSDLASIYDAVVMLNNVEYITFKNITFAIPPTSPTGRMIQATNRPSNIVFSNNAFLNQITTSTDYAGIYFVNDEVSNLELSNNYFVGGFHAIRIQGNSSVYDTNMLIANNTIVDFMQSGIIVFSVAGVHVLNNYIKNGQNSKGVIGITTSNNNFGSIKNNQVYLRGTESHNGITMHTSYGTVANPLEIYNNVVSLDGNSSLGTTGISTVFADTVRIIHNTVYIGQGHTFAASDAFDMSYSDDIVLLNNIFVNNGLSGYVLDINTPSEMTTMNNNVYYSSSNRIAYWNGLKTNLVALQAAHNMDANSMEADPVFTDVANDNLIPVNGGINNMATPISNITTDAFGTARSATPDAGAIEFTGVSHDLSIVNVSLENQQCLSANHDIDITVKNVIGSSVHFSINPITINWSVNGPVTSNGVFSISSGILNSGIEYTFTAAGVNLSIPGDYEIIAYINPNSANLFAGNDTLLIASHTVNEPIYINPSYATVNSVTDTVELSVSSAFFPIDDLMITEICQYSGSTVGAPTTGTPVYLGGDYIEIQGIPGADISGVTIEKWNTSTSTSSPSTSHTFAQGTFLNSQGTYLISTYQGSTSPADYHVVASTTYDYNSSQSSVNVIKSPTGSVLDIVIYGTTSSTPNTLGITTQWSGSGIAGSSSWGIRLESADNNNNTGWVKTNGSPFVQDPNNTNAGVIVPTMGNINGFTWMHNGVVTSTQPDTVIGPFSSSGSYVYVAGYLSITCGLLLDTIIIDAYIANPPISHGDTSICYGDSAPLTITFDGTAPFTFILTDGILTDTVISSTNTYSFNVSPQNTTNYVLMEYWDTMNIKVHTNDTISVNVIPSPSVSITSVPPLCEYDVSVNLNAVPWGGVFYGTGVTGANFDPAVSGVGTFDITYSIVDSNGCVGSDTIVISINNSPNVDLGTDLIIKRSHGITLDAGAVYASYLWNTSWAGQFLVLDSTDYVLGDNNYSVEVTNTVGCKGIDSVIVTVINDVSISNLDFIGEIILYPNPTKGELTIEIDGVINNHAELTLLNSTRQIIWTRTMFNNGVGAFKESFDIRNLAKGVYLLNIKLDGFTRTEKIIVL